MHTRVISYTNGKKGKQAQAARETEKESVRVWVHCRKMDDGVRHKNWLLEKPTGQFWDKLERITIFWETILMGE